MHTLHCFGRVSVVGAGGEVVRLRSSKHLALLVYLVANPDHEHPRDRLAPFFWETDRSQARHSLSQALYDIRSNLPELGVRASVNHVALERGTIDSELDSFEEAVRSSEVDLAVHLYRGDFVPDLESVATPAFERWVEDERQRLQRLAELAFCRYVAECDDRARWGDMCTVALRLLDMNPLQEEAHRAFMRGMWLQGDQQAALDHFHKVERMLARELPRGISLDTQRLVERIRSSRPDLRRPEPGRPERPRMVGRRKEFAHLKNALRQLEGGRGGVVVIRGDAGIGKTRLIEEIRELARLHGVATLESRCFAAETDVSYGPIVDGLQPIVREVTSGEPSGSPTFYQLGVLFPEQFPHSASRTESELEADAGRRRLYEETAALLRAATDQEPRLWIVEDLHWVDASSASLLHYVSRRLREHPLLVLVSVRTGQDLGEAAESLLHDWCGQSEATCVNLAGLSDGEMAELIQEVCPADLTNRQAAFIGGLASGNPFFALEMASAAVDLQDWCPEAIPYRRFLTESLESLLRVRLNGLGLEPIRLLETVAVLERHATPFFVALASSLSTGRVAELARTLYARGLLHDSEGRLEFPHDLTREYVYGNMGELQRAALHLVAGEVLAGSNESVSPSTLAHHFERGGDRPRAYEFALRAAEQSMTGYAHDEAIVLSKLAVAQSTSRGERAAALRILAEAESASGSLGAAESHLKELIDLDVLQSEETILIKLKIARARAELSQFRSAEAILDEVTQGVRALPDSRRDALNVEALHWQLKAAMMRSDIETADGLVASLEQTLPRLQEPRARAIVLHSLAGHSLFTMSIDAASDYCSHALEVLGDKDTDLQIRLRTLHGAILTRGMQFTAAQEVIESTLADAKRVNDVRHILALLNNLACCQLEQGLWSQVGITHASFSEFAEGLSETISSRTDMDVNLANSLFYQGKSRAAAALLEHLIQSSASPDQTTAFYEATALLGLVYAQVGRTSEARRCHDVLTGLSSSDLGAIQDRFKIYWLRAFVARAAKRSAGFVWEEAVNIDESSDRVGHLKLLWLRRLFTCDDPMGIDPIKDRDGSRLIEAGLRWFAYFARRWMMQAEESRIVA